GASGMQLTRFIKLPLCRNAIGTSIILSITSRIAMYENIALTTRGGPGDDTMGLALILVKNITDYNYGMANATAVIMFLIGILTLLIINRMFRMNEPV
ncbi:MAG: sugar ABC transporter permease, partial [Clostridiales bacterium]|nr:sugar ABC transporter permease [Clostridiales bacterium]